MKRFMTLVVLFVFLTSTAFAQTTKQKKGGPRRQLATIIFAGLGGAVLGLSTLSFYGRPQEHLSNIAVGFAVGVIAGTVFVTYKSATSRDYLNDNPPPIDDANQMLRLFPDVELARFSQPLSKDTKPQDKFGARLQLSF